MTGKEHAISNLPDERPLDLSPLRLLVVDDNRHMRELVTAILNALEMTRVQRACDGSEAIDVLKANEIDLVITDWLMDPVCGIQLIKWIRTSDESPDPFLPVIMISSYSTPDRVVEARNAGINEFLVKPISARSLYQRIANLVERPRTFIRSKNYFGPCRRDNDGSGFHGQERRRQPSAPRADGKRGMA